MLTSGRPELGMLERSSYVNRKIVFQTGNNGTSLPLLILTQGHRIKLFIAHKWNNLLRLNHLRSLNHLHMRFHNKSLLLSKFYSINHYFIKFRQRLF